MSLTIISTADQRLAGDYLLGWVRTRMRAGAALVLVPTFAQVLQVQQRLAHEGIGLGVDVTTPSAWLRDMWDVWGDGGRVVEDSARTVIIRRVLQQESKLGLAATPGTVRMLCSLAQRALPWVADAFVAHGNTLTPAERRAVGLMLPYDKTLAACGLVETSTCASLLPQLLAHEGVAVPPVLVAGFNELALMERELLIGLARHGDVTLVVRAQKTPANEQSLAMADLVDKGAREAGVDVRYAQTAVPDASLRRIPELVQLQEALYCTPGVVEPTGAVRLVRPSGPLAEAELVAREVAGLACDGARRVVVAVPDVGRAWRELAPKLLARGMDVRAQLSVPVLGTRAGRAFANYVRTVAELQELDKTWPAPQEGPDGTYVQVGNMDWWPPSELADFLLCDVSHMDAAKARNLSIAWRQNRLLSPGDVLAQLQSAKYTCAAVEAATRELLRGRLGSAASKLLAPFVAGEDDKTKGQGDPSAQASRLPANEEAKAALQAFINVAGVLKELGMSADPKAERSISLFELVDTTLLALESTQMALRPHAASAQGKADVLLVGRSAAAALEPASFDAAVLCGLSSLEYAVPSTEGELDGIMSDLGLELPANALARQRQLFWRLCALPTQALLLEWPQFTADANTTYASVMLTELLSCYKEVPPEVELAEDQARANLATSGVAPGVLCTSTVAPAGKIDDALRRLVMVPQEGQAELPQGLPLLSASQLESYLECPLKWFSLRRLRLADNDADFGPMQMGTFAHRVLELTYAQLFAEGRARLEVGDTSNLVHAHAVLDQQFVTHEQHQHMRAGSRTAFQALVAHNTQEQSAMERLHRDLSTTLDYTAQRLWGFEPYAFEWAFGRAVSATDQQQGGLPALPVATYAGVRVTGTVDRIDINAAGQAVIIDYKHKGPAGFFAEYSAFDRANKAAKAAKQSKDKGVREEARASTHECGGTEEAEAFEFVLPRRIQALMYAQVVRRAFPNLRVVGALYLGTRGDHELSGAVAAEQADAVFGGRLGTRRAPQVVVEPDETFGQQDTRGMEALLDATEHTIARKVERLREGYIEADPCDVAACAFCPVANCERRLQ